MVPRSGLQSLVDPHYAKAGNGRRPVGLGIMLRTYFVQQWFNLSDPGGLIVGREIRQRYKFNRQTPYDLYAHSGDELPDVDCGAGI